MACSLPTKTARSGMEHNAKFKEAWWKDEQLQNKRKKITPKNDPYDFCRRPTTEDTPDYGGPPLERRVTAMSISIEPDSQEPTKVTHSNTEALNTTENTDAKNYIYSSVSKVISGISESDTCSTCSKHKQKLIGSFIHPVFPQFPSWESSSRPRARRRRAEKQHKTEDSHGDNRKEDKNKNKEHGKFRATLSRIPHAIEERLARIEQKCKDAREHVKKTMEVLRREPPDREYTSTGGSYNRSRSPTLKYTTSTTHNRAPTTYTAPKKGRAPETAYRAPEFKVPVKKHRARETTYTRPIYPSPIFVPNPTLFMPSFVCDTTSTCSTTTFC